LDGILEEEAFLVCALGNQGFNPCVVGWYSGSEDVTFTEVPDGDVSILVLLDGILEAVMLWFLLAAQTKFQSLFCWMVFWKTNKKPAHSAGFSFQSLFCWMVFWKERLHNRFRYAHQVSILVLLDGILEVIIIEQADVSYPFQSLFCWMVFWKHNTILKIYLSDTFQSLFCWMVFWKHIWC
jgi:hypothetical protein